MSREARQTGGGEMSDKVRAALEQCRDFLQKYMDHQGGHSLIEGALRVADAALAEREL